MTHTIPNASPDLELLHAAFEAPQESPSHAPPSVQVQPTSLLCDDGLFLQGHWYLPTRTAAKAVAVVNAGTAVPQGFYRAFAQWLAERGYEVLTYDYRGVGASRHTPVTADPSSMLDWARLDMSAALACAEAKRQRSDGRRLPLLVVGHSFGGNGIGLAQGIERADAVLAVAAQSGDWRLWDGVHRWVTAFFFHVWLPTVAHVMGHVPGWVLGGRSLPLPRGVALQWARWGRRRGYYFEDHTLKSSLAFARIRGPVHLWAISDDRVYAPARAVDALAAHFAAADVQRHTLHPSDAGVKRLGHWGAFRRHLGPRVWERWLAPIEAATPTLAAAGVGMAPRR